MDYANLWPQASDDAPWISPVSVLGRAGSRLDALRGLIPQNGITWLYGPSMSFKTFVALDMAAAISAGRPWMGRKTKEALVMFLGAEGGETIHVRRAAAELKEQQVGYLYVMQERPAIDTPDGAETLLAMVDAISDGSFGLGSADSFTVPAAAEAYAKYLGDVPSINVKANPNLKVKPSSIVCFIDTYSQTSSGDDKANVAAYIKALRDAIDAAYFAGIDLAFVVIDHATKAGGSYIGSVAKLNDVDSQIELTRDGRDMLVTAHHRKIKDGTESKPLDLELVPFVFDGLADAYGEPLQTLTVKDGTRGAALAEIANGKAGLLYAMLEAAGEPVADKDMRVLFRQHPENADSRPETVAKAYLRSKVRLVDEGIIEEKDGILRVLGEDSGTGH